MDKTFKELGRAGAIRELYSECGFKPCHTPVFECSDGYVVSASAFMLEGIDFDLTFFPLEHLGRKAVVQAAGELSASLATPVTLKITMGVSAKLDFPQISRIWKGCASAASEYGCRDVAIDLVPSLTGLSIAVAATGTVAKETRSARPIAKSMDLVCITGNVGAAFLGEQILRRGKDMAEKDRDRELGKYRQIVGAYLKPELSPDTVKALTEVSAVPSFGYFCKDSLRDTVLALCADSGLGVKLYVDKLPFAGGSIDAAAQLNTDALQAALKGGDDYCLLFTFPLSVYERLRHDFQSWNIIGHLARPEVGAVLVSPDGLEHGI